MNVKFKELIGKLYLKCKNFPSKFLQVLGSILRSYSFKRFVASIITIFLIATLTFFMMRAIPGGPFTREKEIPEEILKALEAKYNLDDPIWMQYVDYIKGLVRLDLGPSFSIIGYNVDTIITSTFPLSAKIGGIASIVVVLIGVPVGIVSALKQNQAVDYIVMFIATILITVPSFVVATLIMYFAGSKWGLLPIQGADAPLWFIGPVIALSGFSLSFVARLTRSSMLEVLRQDYVRTARANGISEIKVIGKHALKNALIPVITYIGPMIAAIITGSFVVEKIFALPGLGQYFVQAVNNRDYTLIMGTTIFYAAIYIVMVFIVDVLYSIIDPRIKLKG